MAIRTIATRLTLEGEQEFKREMGEVNNAMKTLKSEMSLVDAEFRGQANTMEALRKKHDVLSQEYDQQAEKVRALEQTVRDASDAYGDSDKRTDSYRQQLNRAKVALIDLNDELQENTKYLKEAEDSADGCAKSIDGYGKKIKDANEQTNLFGTLVAANLTSDAIKGGIKSLGMAIATLPVSIVKDLAGAFSQVYSAVTDMADAAGDIDDAAKRTGTTAQEYQKWSYAAKLGGIEVSKLESLMVRQQKSFADATEGVKATSEAYKRLGIDINAIGDADAAFEKVIYTLADMEDETTRNALANDIFGKSYADLAPLLAEGSAGIAAWRQEIVDLGGVMSDEAVEAGASFGDSLDRLRTRFEGMKNYLGGEFIPAFTDMADGLTDILGGNVDEGVEKIKSGMSEFEATMDRLGPAAEEALDLFLDEFIDHFPEIVECGGDIVLKLIKGLGEKAPDIIGAAADSINTLVRAFLDPENLKAIGEAGISIGKALLDGVMSILSNLGAMVLGEVNATAVNELASYAPSDSRLSRSRAEARLLEHLDGSHAAGLYRVPYDGYVAELHRGERVLTAGEADAYNALARYGGAGQSMTAQDFRTALAQAVNAMTAADRDLKVTVVSTMNVDGREFYRETLEDLRAVSRAAPEIGGTA